MPLYQFKVKQKLISHVYVLFSAKHKRVLVFSGNFTPLDDKANHSHTKGNVWAWNEMLLVSIFTILSELGLYHLLFYNKILSLCNANVNREHKPSTCFPISQNSSLIRRQTKYTCTCMNNSVSKRVWFALKSSTFF